MLRTAIKLALALLVVGFLAYRAWSVAAAEALWRAGDRWTVRVERVQGFGSEPSPSWTEVNRMRFEVVRVTPAVPGTRIQVRVTFAEPVLNGYTVLELTYDGDMLKPLSGRLTAAGRPDVDWKTARPLLEASLVPFDGLAWREVVVEKDVYRLGSREWDAYRVQREDREYGWAEDVTWWLWYKAGDQVRAELVECSCWSGKARR